MTNGEMVSTRGAGTGLFRPLLVALLAAAPAIACGSDESEACRTLHASPPSPIQSSQSSEPSSTTTLAIGTAYEVSLTTRLLGERLDQLTYGGRVTFRAERAADHSIVSDKAPSLFVSSFGSIDRGILPKKIEMPVPHCSGARVRITVPLLEGLHALEIRADETPVRILFEPLSRPE